MATEQARLPVSLNEVMVALINDADDLICLSRHQSVIHKRFIELPHNRH
jgi:hypothetical protein